MEEGIAIFRKLFPDKQIISMADLVEEAENLPVPFQNALVIQINAAKRRKEEEPIQRLLSWYLLIESAECVLIRRGQRDWYLPCLYQGIRATCCPFVHHIAKSDWENLHSVLGTSTMRWLLLNCILFSFVGSRVWLQVCGPIVKGQLDVAFPFVFKTGRAVLKKPTALQQIMTPSAEQLTPSINSGCSSSSSSSVLRPLKKIRIHLGDGQQVSNRLISSQESRKRELVPSIVPPLKKIRLQRRNSHGDLEYLGDEIQVQKLTEIRRAPTVNVKQSGRRRRTKRKAIQKVDHRRAFDGSLVIFHDEILYSHSGWTHFQITHPLLRSSPEDTVTAILNCPVGGSIRTNGVELSQFHQFVELMWKNHRRCRYTSILRQLLKTDSAKERLAVRTDRVNLFICVAIKTVIPVQLLGGMHNRKVLLRNVERFIRAGKGTLFTLNDIMQSVKSSKCRWLDRLDSLPLQVSLLARLFKWLFLDWIKPLIRQHFYVTETTYGRNRLFFHTKAVWQRMRNHMMKSMCSTNAHQQLAALRKSDAAGSEKLMLHSRLRFIPKANGSRPIMSTVFQQCSLKEVNDTRLLLSTIGSLYPEGMDAKSTYNLHRKWADFVRRRTAPMYFVHADVQDAYGSIVHAKLVDILMGYRSILPAELNIRTLSYVSADGRRSKNFRMVPFLNDQLEWVKRLPLNSILLDMGRKETFDTQKLLNLAIRSIQEVHVTHLKEHYSLQRGIPQGSRLSSSLCHIYYGHMVREHLNEFLSHPDDLLLRVVDDFLYLTPSYQRGRAFYNRIHQGFPNYNAHANTTKSSTNLPSLGTGNDNVTATPLSQPVWPSFCGLQFNTKTLELRGNYSNYERDDIIHCITPSVSKPGGLLLKRIQAISTLKIDMMYLDSTVNRKPTVVRSMYHACLMSAFRFHAIVKHFLLAAINVDFLAHVVKECSSKMCVHVRSAGRKKDVTIKLTVPETRWLCLEAFERKLRRHGQLYAKLLPVIGELKTQSQSKLKSQNLEKLQCWIGKRFPRSFRRMKSSV